MIIVTATEIPVINRNFSDINPVAFGYEQCEPGHKFGPWVRNFYLIHYVCRGEGIFENAEGSHRLKKGDIFIICPDDVTVYEADAENPWEYIWIGFTGKLAEPIERLPDRVLHYGANTFFSALYAEQLKSTREEFLAGKILEILSYLLENEGRENNYVKQAQDYIKACFMKDISAESVAETIGLSRRYLSRLFKDETGAGIQEYIIGERLKNAKKLLSGGASVGEAARYSGFCDAFNFSKTFKKRIGVSPSEYKSRKK